MGNELLLAIVGAIGNAVAWWLVYKEKKNKNNTDRDIEIAPNVIDKLNEVYQQQTARLYERIERLEAKIEQADRGRDSMVGRIAVLENNVKVMGKQNESLNLENKITDGQLKTLKVRYAELEGRYNTLKRKYTELKEKYKGAIDG
jgi:chromosome segregation ATPase